MELMALEITNLRVLSGIRQGQKAHLGPEVSMLKIKGSEIIQTLAELKMHAWATMRCPMCERRWIWIGAAIRC